MSGPISDLMAQQQVLVGMVGATVVGGALYALRQAPGRALQLAREHFTVTLTLDQGLPAYQHLNLWLAKHKQAQRARRLMVTEFYDHEAAKWSKDLTLGPGWHLLRHEGRWVLVHRHVTDPDAMGKVLGAGQTERLTITTFGTGQGTLRSLMRNAERAFNGSDLVQVYVWRHGGWYQADKSRARPLETVFMPPAQLARILDDVKRFLGSRERYLRRGVPWRRGYLFEGPPGTGKSTLIRVIGGVTGRALYVINLANVAGDNDLMAAFNGVDGDGAVVIEDIDCVRITRDREGPPPPRAPEVNPGGVPAPVEVIQEQKGVTLSGLLNAIDGIASREGRLLFVTSNHAEVLDPALLRPGRVDVREVIGRLGEEEARAMYRAWFPEGPDGWFDEAVAPRLPVAAADLQNLLLALDEEEVA